MRAHRLGAAGEPHYTLLVHVAAQKEFLALPERVQSRFQRAFDGLRHDPLAARPGLDARRLGSLWEDGHLFRLRVGTHRALYLVVPSQRLVRVLLFDRRGLGYDRLLRSARARLG